MVAAIDVASQHEIPCVLNPAPAIPIPDRVLAQLFCIIPNQTEAELLTGVAVVDERSAAAAARRLLQRSVKNGVITMGENGALFCNAGGAFLENAATLSVQTAGEIGSIPRRSNFDDRAID